MQSRGALWPAPQRAGGARGGPAANLSLPRRPRDPVTARELATYALKKGGVARRSVGPRVRWRRWRPGLPLEGPPGLCPARLLRIPGPGPAAGRPGAPARRQRRTRGRAGPGLRRPGRRRAGAAGAAKLGRALRGWGRRRTLPARVAGPLSGGASCSTTSFCSRGSSGGGSGCSGEINKSGLSFGSALAAILSRTSERPESSTEAGRRHLRVANVRAI